MNRDLTPMSEKNKQDLQNPKLTPIALATPSNRVMPDDSPKESPEIGTGADSLHGISTFFSINAWCLAQTNQMSSQKAKLNSCTKATMF
ncbi:hypothetical protein G9A89_012752 [Geosiphon pyriformis]|nr:hypothetical protein G9A89_012752 [Geosiphon pyriformis]